MLLSIAWRNLWRNKIRSAVIFSSIAVGIVGAVVSDGFMSGMTDQRVNAAIANEVADIQIHQPAFLLNGEMQYLIPHAGKMVKKIREQAEVKGVSLRLKTQAMAASANAGTGINLYGVRPADERKVSDLHAHIIQGRYLSEKQKIPVIIGQKLARKLDLGIGDKLIVTLTDSSGTITSSAFRITGIYKTSNDRFDAVSVFVDKKDLAKVIGYPAASGDELAIRLKDSRKTPAVMKKLEQIFQKELQKKEIILQSWDQIQPMLKSMVTMMNFFSYLFLLIILAALAFAIINTMLMAVMERTREIGMLMALGMNKHKIFSLIMLETVLLSVVGATLGLLVSLFIINHYATYGFDLSSVASGLNYIGYSARIFFRVNTGFYIMSILLVALIAVLSSISPALKALKLQPATAIRDMN